MVWGAMGLDKTPNRRSILPGDPCSLLLNAALVRAEQHMAEVGEGTGGANPIPPEWFAWHDLAKKLRPLVFQAEQTEARYG